LTGILHVDSAWNENGFAVSVGKRLPKNISIFPRFTEEARSANLAVVDLLNQIAQRKNATPAQIALAWLLAQKPWIVPIPGTTKIHRLEENIGSASVELTSEDLTEINMASSKIPIQGNAFLNPSCECLTAKVPSQ
jgi:aryl-alcohol dehydrogenase-like predicted oxidoreductase